jgi:uncharacterized lipoprotein YmbA
VADYLQRETLLQRQPDGSLQAATDGRWAGSLSSDIDQLLVRQVAGIWTASVWCWHRPLPASRRMCRCC